MTHDGHDTAMTEKELEAQLEAMLEKLEIEEAPASLSRRLHRIPAEHGRKTWRWPWQGISSPFPQWAMAPALAVIPLLVISFVLLQPDRPSQAEVEQAHLDVAIAFAYLDKAGLRTGAEIQSVLGGELRHSVKDQLSEHLPFTESIRKEESS